MHIIAEIILLLPAEPSATKGFLFLKTRKTLKKLEKDFIKETQSLSQQQLKDIKKQKIAKEILVSHSRT